MLCLGRRGVACLLKSQYYLKPSIFNLFQRTRGLKIERLEKVPELPGDYEERNEKLKNALSPHIKIYKFEMPSIQSISHRTTGIILSTYLIVLGIGGLVLPHEFRFYIETIDSWELNQSLITFGKFMFALPFTVHFIGGIKHLMWDVAPSLLKRIRYVFVAGYIVLGLGVVSAAILASIKTAYN